MATKRIMTTEAVTALRKEMIDEAGLFPSNRAVCMAVRKDRSAEGEGQDRWVFDQGWPPRYQVGKGHVVRASIGVVAFL